MKALTLQQANVPQGEQQQATCGRSLSSNYVPLSLENKFLSQTSTLMPQPCSPLFNFAAQPSSCPSLQPSSLSSTSSSLLSTSSSSLSFASPLLSTENKLLASRSPLSFSLTSVPSDSLLSTSLASSALLNRFAHPPSFLHHVLGEEQKRDDEEEEDREETSEAMQSCFEETSVVHEMFCFNFLTICLFAQTEKLPLLLRHSFKIFDKHIFRASHLAASLFLM